MRPLPFEYEIQCSTTFILSVFANNSYFWQRRAPNRIYFSISIQCNILNMHLGFYAPWVSRYFWKYRYYIDNIDIDFKKYWYYRYWISCKNITTRFWISCFSSIGQNFLIFLKISILQLGHFVGAIFNYRWLLQTRFTAN